MANTTQSTNQATDQNGALRTVIIAGLLVAAFFGAYKFASARSGQGANATISAAQAQVGAAASAAGASAAGSAGSSGAGASTAGSGCACCGNGSSQPTAGGVTGNPVEGTAVQAGGIQAIGVKVGTTYSPNIIKLKAGIPAEITFGQGGGCTAQIISQDLGFSEDVSAGPKVVKLPALQAGTYSFSCGMGMVLGKIVVE